MHHQKLTAGDIKQTGSSSLFTFSLFTLFTFSTPLYLQGPVKLKIMLTQAVIQNQVLSPTPSEGIALAHIFCVSCV